MKDDLHAKLIANIDSLREIISHHSTESLLGHCGWAMHMKAHDVYRAFGLKSPHAECLYALGMMIGTPEPEHARPVARATWLAVCQRLEDIQEVYAENFSTSFGTPGYALKPEQHLLVMDYFLHHLGMQRIAAINHLTDRIRTTLAPFDMEIRAAAGISASDAVQVANWIMQVGQSDVEQYNAAVRANRVGVRLETAWESRWDWLTDREWHLRLADRRYTDSPIDASRADKLFTVSPKDMRREFGDDVTGGFVRCFVSVRGAGPGLQYPTDANPAHQRPVFRIDGERLFHPPGRFIYNAILDELTAVVMVGYAKGRFLQRRDDALETSTERCLKQFFGPSATILTSAFEEDGHEHDVVVIWSDKLLVVESKAAPPTQAFRDPEKAWVRLSRAFRSEKGIQKAFEQARRLVRRTLSGSPVRLLDQKRRSLAELPPGSISHAYGVCVTLEEHGPVATDLSMLLKREPGDEYPWAVSINELEVILDGFRHVGIGPERFFKFLEQRRRLHGTVLPYDEAEVAGIFLRYGSLDGLLDVEQDALVILMPKDGFVFDEIDLERRGGPKAVLTSDRPYRLMRH